MQTCTVTIENEVSIKLDGLDLKTRRECVKAVKYFLPHARYSAAFKLGRWDGSTSFCTMGGRTYLNLLDKILPLVTDNGYDIDIDDLRKTYEFEFENIDENYLSHLVWPTGHRNAGEHIVLRDYQVQVINECVNNLQGLTISPTASGKCQPLSSKIKIPGGWTTMKDISVGNIISTPDGSTATVLNVYNPGVKDIYEITFEDGRTARCCKDHLWKVHNHNWTDKWKLLSVNELLEFKKTNKRVMSIPLASMASDTTDVELPIQPWLLGVLLGDGSFRNNNIGITSADQFILDKISGLLHTDYIIHHIAKYDYNVKFKSKEVRSNEQLKWINKQKRHANGNIIKGQNLPTYHLYKSIIKNLNLANTYSDTKFIPELYLNASYSQRLEMIQGLLDTDGYVDKSGRISFTTTSNQLAKDFAYLVRSIGGIARHTCGKNRTYKYNGVITPCKDCYNVAVYHPTPEILVTLPRKLQLIQRRIIRLSNNKLFGLARKALLNIIDIKKVSTEEVRCIMIDHPDHLYVTDDFVVTHNTIVTASLSMIAQKYGRTIVIVPNRSLVLQTEEDYRNIGLDVGVLYGDRKEYDKMHTICTWQSLNILDKKNKDALDDNQFAIFMNNVIAVICDEVHLVKNTNVIHTLLTTTFADIPIRWGLTGTVPEEEYNQVSLYSAIGPIIGNLTAKELQDAGHLAQCHVNMLQTMESVTYRTYPEELKHLVTNKERLAWLARMIRGIALTGNTLVLIDRIETGKLLQELMPECVFISGNMKATDRKDHYKDINLDDNAIMVATFGTTSTGISINRIFNLVLLEPGKSFVRVIQSIGRGLRKADDKDAISVFDISSKCKFSHRHMLKRKKFYDQAQYPYNVTKVSYN